MRMDVHRWPFAHRRATDQDSVRPAREFVPDEIRVALVMEDERCAASGLVCIRATIGRGPRHRREEQESARVWCKRSISGLASARDRRAGAFHRRNAHRDAAAGGQSLGVTQATRQLAHLLLDMSRLVTDAWTRARAGAPIDLQLGGLARASEYAARVSRHSAAAAVYVSRTRRRPACRQRHHVASSSGDICDERQAAAHPGRAQRWPR